MHPAAVVDGGGSLRSVGTFSLLLKLGLDISVEHLLSMRVVVQPLQFRVNVDRMSRARLHLNENLTWSDNCCFTLWPCLSFLVCICVCPFNPPPGRIHVGFLLVLVHPSGVTPPGAHLASFPSQGPDPMKGPSSFMLISQSYAGQSCLLTVGVLWM